MSENTFIFFTPTVTKSKGSLLEKQRELRLAQKKAASRSEMVSNEMRVNDKIKVEIQRFCEIEPINIKRNPLLWWKENELYYPMLSKYVRNNIHFQATSVSSKRCFNKDSLIYDERRMKLLAERSETLILLQDHYMRRENYEKFLLCNNCSGNRTKYNIECYEH